VIVLAATVIGTLIAEGNTFRVLRTPAGAWRIARRNDLECGLNFTGHGGLFGCFNGKVPDADETDTQCWRILGHASVSLQRAMIEDRTG
jgi:hypothetical protein